MDDKQQFFIHDQVLKHENYYLEGTIGTIIGFVGQDLIIQTHIDVYNVPKAIVLNSKYVKLYSKT